MSTFTRTVGINYSGAQTPTASLSGLRAYAAEANTAPIKIPPPPSPRMYWTCKGLAEWLVEHLVKGVPMLARIDPGLSFPLRYFLDDFRRHRPTDDASRAREAAVEATVRAVPAR